MPTTPPLWSGRDAEPHDPDHEWLSAPAPTRIRPKPLPPATGGRVADSRVNQIYARVQDGVVQVRAGSGSGTGFVIDANGSIVTNAHVVGSASRVQVRFDDSRSIAADVRGTDPSTALAVLRVDPG